MIPGRQQLRFLLLLGTALTLSLIGDSMPYAVLSNEVDGVGISPAAVGTMLDVSRLIRIPANLLAGALNDLFWPKTHIRSKPRRSRWMTFLG